MIRAELTKLRSVRGWLVGLAVAVVAVVGLGMAVAYGTNMSCLDQACPQPPTGPGGEAVEDHFSYAHQELDGDGSIVAHVVSFDAPVAWSKAGLMIKDGTSPGAAYASVLLTGGHGVRMQDDFTEDTAGPSAAGWLKLSRSGDKISGYASADGSTWSPVGTATLAGLPRTVLIGMFVASPQDVTSATSPHGGSIVHASATRATAVFDQVSRGGSWTFTEVGAPPAGSGQGTPGGSGQGASPIGGTQAGGAVSLSGTGDIAPAGMEAGAGVQQTMLGLVAALIAVIVVAVLFITGEYRYGLIRTTFAAMPSRGRVIGAKAVVIGAATFAAGLLAAAVTLPLATHVLRAHDVILLPTSAGTKIWLVVGAALLLSLAALFAYGMGALLRRGLPAAAAAVVLLVLPYVLAVSSVLPAGATQWLLRVTPAAGFAFQQIVPAYHQVAKPYTPADGYFPLAPWAGLAVLAGWAAVVLGLAVLRIRRVDV